MITLTDLDSCSWGAGDCDGDTEASENSSRLGEGDREILLGTLCVSLPRAWFRRWGCRPCKWPRGKTAEAGRTGKWSELPTSGPARSSETLDDAALCGRGRDTLWETSAVARHGTETHLDLRKGVTGAASDSSASHAQRVVQE